MHTGEKREKSERLKKEVAHLIESKFLSQQILVTLLVSFYLFVYYPELWLDSLSNLGEGQSFTLGTLYTGRNPGGGVGWGEVERGWMWEGLARFLLIKSEAFACP